MYKVCVWPDGIQEKDINEMILGGKQAADIKLIIDNNTFVGLSAMIKVKTWKKV